MAVSPDHQRVEEFKREITAMRLKDPATSRDRVLLRFGVLLMVVGIAVAVFAYFGSHGTTNPLEQRDYLVVAMIGTCLTIAGSALFLRYSIAQFLRFWLARLTYEQQMAVDRLIEARSEQR